ncbi:MAG: acyl-CoA dehydrogenase family protein [Sphingobium sp.]
MSDLDAYRLKAREWLTSQASIFGREQRRGLSHDEDLAFARRWQIAKQEAGYTGITWPASHGGQGLSALEKVVYEQEEIPYGFPNDYFAVSLGMPVPIMLRYLPDGDPWKLERARKALRGEEIWCQLFSEPAAGSDLAGLRTTAVKDGDDWVVNGQKLWTTWAQHADYGVIVVRTDPNVPKHKGLTYFWLDMKSPGITVRPVKLAAGDEHVNEVFFDDVRIADTQRLGPVGGGFGVAMETLIIERYSATDPSGFGPPVALLVDQSKALTIKGRPAIEDGRVRERLARTYAMQNGLASIYKRTILSLQAGLEPGPEGAVHKLVSVRARQKLSEYAIDLQGVQGIRHSEQDDPKQTWQASWMTAPTGRIAGGADEMLLNTIAERILGLPQDHRPDKGVPFNQIPR